jgi:hypothetical protein
VWPKHVAPLNKPLLTPYYRKESCDLTVINKDYIVTLHNGMYTIKLHRSTIPFLHFACAHVPVVVRADMCVSMYGTAFFGVIFKTVICIVYYHSRSLFFYEVKRNNIRGHHVRPSLCDLTLKTKLFIRF